MPYYGQRSTKNLNTCHPLLQFFFREIIKTFDHTIVWGHREEEQQESAFLSNASTKHWPDSKHNKKPSIAVDAVPWPSMWRDEAQLYYFSGYVRAKSEALGIPLRSGADWDGDYLTNDQKLRDAAHFELIGEPNEWDKILSCLCGGGDAGGASSG